MDYRILAGDCIARMQMMDKHSVDDIITDPPYEIGFMAKNWDSTGIAFNPATWKEAHRVLKPNGLLVVFGATRTHHRIAHAIERAGFEIIEIIGWTYSTGFPKSYNISKGIDKQAGAEREIVGYSERNDRLLPSGQGGYHGNIQPTYKERGRESTKLPITKAATPEAKQWEGWGTALKPAWEPIIIARKKGSKRIVKNISKRIHIPKANKKERNRGLEGFEYKNDHPTVKPVQLMKILVEEYSEKGGTGV